MPVQERNYYDLLGVPPTASAGEIRAAYRRLIKESHPDLNRSDPRAAERTRLLNEAWEVLGDPAQRAGYDQWLKGVESQPSEEAYGEEVEIPRFRCEACGAENESLRYAFFLYTVSVLLATFKQASGGLLCARCRFTRSLGLNLVTGFLGWWGIPWGPIYSLQSLLQNAIGGVQPKELNANLLAMQAYGLYQQGEFGRALAALRESYRLQKDPNVAQFIEELSPYVQGPIPSIPRSHRFLSAANLLTVLGILLGAGYAISSWISTSSSDTSSSYDSSGSSTYSSPSAVSGNYDYSPPPAYTPPAQVVEEPQPPANPTRLRNGARILKDKSPSGLGLLTIDNGSDHDAAVKLVKSGEKKAYRYYYVRRGEKFTIPRIAPGIYEVYVRSGVHWVKKKRKFEFYESISTCEGEDAYFEFNEVEEEGGVRYSRWTLTLHPVVGGTVRQRPISEDEFGEDQ